MTRHQVSNLVYFRDKNHDDLKSALVALTRTAPDLAEPFNSVIDSFVDGGMSEDRAISLLAKLLAELK